MERYTDSSNKLLQHLLKNLSSNHQVNNPLILEKMENVEKCIAYAKEESIGNTNETTENKNSESNAQYESFLYQSCISHAGKMNELLPILNHDTNNSGANDWSVQNKVEVMIVNLNNSIDATDSTSLIERKITGGKITNLIKSKQQDSKEINYYSERLIKSNYPVKGSMNVLSESAAEYTDPHVKLMKKEIRLKELPKANEFIVDTNRSHSNEYSTVEERAEKIDEGESIKNNAGEAELKKFVGQDQFTATIDNVDKSTYEEIIHLLSTIDEDDDEDKDASCLNESDKSNQSTKKREFYNLNGIYSRLDKLKQKAECARDGVENDSSEAGERLSPPRLEKLLNKNVVELAHEVLSLKLRIEDQKKGINLLRETLAETRKIIRKMNYDHKEYFDTSKRKAETILHRHQNFIKQLLNEKIKLNETVKKLVLNLKSNEERFKKTLKAIEERHIIEIRKVKQCQAAADKIKRDKWMEYKIRKIKEMTVKGLEPELHKMAERQHQEMAQLKRLQKVEIEAVEFEANRRASESLNRLKMELAKEKEVEIQKETNLLRIRMEKKFEEEMNKLEAREQVLKENLIKQGDKIARQEVEYRHKIADYKRELDDEKRNLIRDFNEKLEQARQQYLMELEKFRESTAEEKRTWLDEYQKRESANFLNKEKQLRDQFIRERDRDIETIIEMVERESAKFQEELNEASENKVKKLREKLEKEIADLENNEKDLRSKLSEAKSSLSSKNEIITQLDCQVRQTQMEIDCLKKCCEKMTLERKNLTNTVRKEFENSIEELKKEKENTLKKLSALRETHSSELAKKDQIIQEMKNRMQRELAKVYSRVKAAAKRREIVSESLRKENKELVYRCQQLELLLDKQRENLLL